MLYEFFTHTDVGRVRSNNEDALTIDPDHQLAVLADGMGGYNAGEVASQIATTCIPSEFTSSLKQAWASTSSPAPLPVEQMRQALERAVHQANQAIYQTSHQQPGCAGMGTTLVVAAFQGRHLVLGHVGDSRGYRWRDGQLQQLTRDHSLVQEQLDAGLITAEQASFSTQRNLVTRALGVSHQVELEAQELEVLPGDLYLLCSDGLTDMVRDEQIAAILARGGDLQELAHTLVAIANHCGGRDNISVLLAHAKPATRH